MRNQILIIIGAILLSAGMGLAIPIAVAGNVQGLEVDQVQLKNNALSQFNAEMVRLVAADYDQRVSAEMETQVAAGREQLAAEAGGTEKTNQAGLPAGADMIYADATSAERAKAAVLTEMAAIGSGAGKTADPAVKLEEDVVLAGYVDTAYLSGMAGGGLTPQEDSDMQTYLKARFLPDDYELAKTMNHTYAELVTE